jgi:hypothetical protein
LHLRQAIPHGPLDHRRGKLDLFILAQAGGLAEPFDQRPLFRLAGGKPAGIFIGLFGFLDGGLLLDFPRGGDQIVDFSGMAGPSSMTVSPGWQLADAAESRFDPDQAREPDFASARSSGRSAFDQKQPAAIAPATQIRNAAPARWEGGCP